MFLMDWMSQLLLRFLNIRGAMEIQEIITELRTEKDGLEGVIDAFTQVFLIAAEMRFFAAALKRRPWAPHSFDSESACRMGTLALLIRSRGRKKVPEC